MRPLDDQPLAKAGDGDHLAADLATTTPDTLLDMAAGDGDAPTSPTALDTLGATLAGPAEEEEAGADEMTDGDIWARWARGDELAEILKDMCGYTRGRLADETRDRVYRVVVPQIVTELGAEAIVARLLDGRTPLRAQREQYEELLRRMNRQAGPVTGVIRERTEARLVAAMRAARELAAVPS